MAVIMHSFAFKKKKERKTLVIHSALIFSFSLFQNNSNLWIISNQLTSLPSSLHLFLFLPSCVGLKKKLDSCALLFKSPSSYVPYSTLCACMLTCECLFSFSVCVVCVYYMWVCVYVLMCVLMCMHEFICICGTCVCGVYVWYMYVWCISSCVCFCVHVFVCVCIYGVFVCGIHMGYEFMCVCVWCVYMYYVCIVYMCV